MTINTTKKHLGLYSTVVIAVFALGIGVMSFGDSAESNVVGPGAPPNPKELRTSMSETIQSMKIDPDMPDYLPNDAKFEKSYVSEDGKVAEITFSSEDGIRIAYYVQEAQYNPLLALEYPSEPIKITVEEEGKESRTIYHYPVMAEYERTTINGLEAVLVKGKADSSDPLPKIVWWNDNIFYQVSSDLPNDELTKIAQSVR